MRLIYDILYTYIFDIDDLRGLFNLVWHNPSIAPCYPSIIKYVIIDKKIPLILSLFLFNSCEYSVRRSPFPTSRSCEACDPKSQPLPTHPSNSPAVAVAVLRTSLNTTGLPPHCRPDVCPDCLEHVLISKHCS